MPKEFEKISPTAVGVAGLRALFTNMPYSRETYQEVKKITRVPFYMNVPSPFNRLARYFPHALESVAGLEIRYLSVNEVLEQLGEHWILVEVAAGLSARSLERSGRQDLYLETDLPDMLELKKNVFGKILESKGISPPPKHEFEVLNALDANGWDRLGKKYFAGKSAKIAVFHEGLLGYLSLEEKTSVRDNLKDFFATYAIEGMWISTDFSAPPMPRDSRISRFVRKKIERDTERKFHRFINKQAAAEFLRAGGFKVEFRPNDTVLDQLTCIPKMHLKPERIQQILANYEVCVANLSRNEI